MFNYRFIATFLKNATIVEEFRKSGIGQYLTKLFVEYWGLLFAHPVHETFRCLLVGLSDR